MKSIICTLTLFFTLGTVYLAQVSHDKWDALVKEHVSDEGKVNYKGFVKDKKKLENYLDILSKNHPSDKWSKNERLAYWINAYNAYTVKLIVDNYPVKSIKDLGGSIYKVNTPWDIKFIEIGDETYDLNNIEHSILRREFEEPRIHFAVVCASVSCPKLRNEAYIAAKIDAQLDDQAKSFINDKSKNDISGPIAHLSKYFKWYDGDFEEKGTLVEYINKYSEEKISEETEIEFKEYNWNLNE